MLAVSADTAANRKKCTNRLVEVVSNRISQSANCIIQDQQILVLVFSKSKNQSIQNETEIWDQFCASFFLKGGKSTKKNDNKK